MPSREKALHDLFVGLFTVEHFRVFLPLEYGSSLVAALPGGSISFEHFAFEAMEELARRRLIAARLFAALTKRAPAAYDEIAAVAGTSA